MRSTSSSLPLLLVVVAGALSWPAAAAAAAAHVDEADEQRCIERTADYIAKAEIDAQTRALVEAAREHYHDADQPDRRKARTEGCFQLQMHLHMAPEFVPCFARDLDHEDEDEHKLVHIELIKPQHLEANPACKDVIEAYFVCRATNAAAGDMKKSNLFEAITSRA